MPRLLSEYPLDGRSFRAASIPAVLANYCVLFLSSVAARFHSSARKKNVPKIKEKSSSGIDSINLRCQTETLSFFQEGKQHFDFSAQPSWTSCAIRWNPWICPDQRKQNRSEDVHNPSPFPDLQSTSITSVYHVSWVQFRSGFHHSFHCTSSLSQRSRTTRASSARCTQSSDLSSCGPLFVNQLVAPCLEDFQKRWGRWSPIPPVMRTRKLLKTSASLPSVPSDLR